MGMQPEEFVWKAPDGGANADPDGDGVVRELSVGDITALVVYNASQETPQPAQRLVELGMIQPIDAAMLATVEKGRALFQKAGCAGCHLPEMRLQNTVFEEPTNRGNGAYYDHALAAKDKDYDPARAVRFDVLGDTQPPHAARLSDGSGQILLYGDLKRHHMGRQLADPGGPQPPITSDFAPLTVDGSVALIPATDFLTAELWGVGNTGPYLHDARAGTLEEAILFHGEDKPPAVGDPGRSEAQEARDAFAAMSKDERAALVTFLRSLLTFSPED
jgi:cytochrome c peroxidase